jgi:hypothetical protein
MSKITTLKIIRREGTDSRIPPQGFKRQEVICPRCKKIHLISIGQLVRCKCVKKKYLPKG